MFEQLNIRSREVVTNLVTGRPVSIGGKTIGPLDADKARVLCLIAANLPKLHGLTGSQLAEMVVTLSAETEISQVSSSPEARTSAKTQIAWKLGKVRVCSFRGLAPAGKAWDCDFNSKSHLLYGPNGCGKSSLLGAIAWCLTGRVFRDDCPPSVPSDVEVFTAETKAKRAGTRPNALTLLNHKGDAVSCETNYWVELQFVAEDHTGVSQELWIRRHSVDDLAKSSDGSSWTPISILDEAGINELDAELHILMPARIPHLRFGEDPDLIRLFSQIVGLDDLEKISEVADRAGRALNTDANKTEKGEQAAEDGKISGATAAIEQAATAEVKSLRTYTPATAASRTLRDVEDLGKELVKTKARWKKQLVQDISLDVPGEGTPEFKQFQKHLEELTGRVQGAMDELERPLSAVFSKSVWSEPPTASKVETVAEELDAFEERARQQIRDRLKWAIREAEDSKASLMLAAARHFPKGSNECPVCTRNLDPVPAVKARLEEMRPLVDHPHLKKEIDDLERELVHDLDQIVSQTQRNEGSKSLHDRLLDDWRNLKESRFVGLLRTIADRYDSIVDDLADSIRMDPIPEATLVACEYSERFPETFSSLDEAFNSACKYVQLVRSMVQYSGQLSQTLERTLQATAADKPDSLLDVLQRGRQANKQLQALEPLHKNAQVLWKAQKRRDELVARIKKYRQLAKAAGTSKSLGELVRAETTTLVKEIEPRMKKHYSRLYDDEVLLLDMLTPGHAANPKVRNQMNVYLRAGNQRVPVGPFCNRGRIRALALSFVFSLLEKAEGALTLLVLDDPAVSLDDEHKARFVDKLVGPSLDTKQVILATHYERFYKVAEPVFSEAERLQLPPRRTTQDAVSFEPMDLLQRVENALNKGDCSWRETGINLRRWAERTLHTISGYCPKPFVVFNKIPGSVDAYKRISDPRIATKDRDCIVTALTSPEFVRVMHRIAHDEEPTPTEVRDAFQKLKECQKAVKREIERFKGLYRHELLDRALEPRASIEVLSLRGALPDSMLEITARAAAASNGVGVTWTEEESARLCGYQAALVKLDVLDPVARTGQYVLLDPDDRIPEDSDLVVAQTEDGKRYARRFWEYDHIPYLEGVNLTSPYSPIQVRAGLYNVRRIVGVLFDGPGLGVDGKVGDEWVPVGSGMASALSNLFGIRVEGTSMEPVARHGQVVLVHQEDATASLKAGELACVDCEGIGAVIKRCYPGKREWILCPVNPTVVEDPIRIAVAEIHHVYCLAGVLFELRSEID